MRRLVPVLSAAAIALTGFFALDSAAVARGREDARYLFASYRAEAAERIRVDHDRRLHEIEALDEVPDVKLTLIGQEDARAEHRTLVVEAIGRLASAL